MAVAKLKITRNKMADAVRKIYPSVDCYSDGNWYLVAKYPPMAFGLPRRWVLGRAKNEIDAWGDAYKRVCKSI